MALKVLMLNTREDVIADTYELCVGEGDSRRVVGYRMNKPCKIWMKTEEVPSSPGNNTHIGHLQLKPFTSLSDDVDIDLSADTVLAIINPVEQAISLYEKYRTSTTPKTDDQTNSPDNETDADKSD